MKTEAFSRNVSKVFQLEYGGGIGLLGYRSGIGSLGVVGGYRVSRLFSLQGKLCI